MSDRSVIEQRARRELERLKQESLYRETRTTTARDGVFVDIDGHRVLSFASNDYLGLAAHPEIAETIAQLAKSIPVGAGASHLLGGHHEIHAQTARQFAAMVNKPAALLFSTGYMANLAIIGALLRRDDIVIADKLNHACLNDGAQLARAKLVRYPHRDMVRLEQLLAQYRGRHVLVCTDSVFSMDGTIAPLAEMARLCAAYDAVLLIDDAHGFGISGNGGGAGAMIDGEHVIVMATFGKAVGVAGAAVAACDWVIDSIINRARPYMFTTALSPLVAGAILRALELVQAGEDLRARLAENITLFRQSAKALSIPTTESTTQIQPIPIADIGQLSHVSEQLLRAHQIWIPAIRPPTVATGRLRMGISALHQPAHIETALAALAGLLAMRD